MLHLICHKVRKPFALVTVRHFIWGLWWSCSRGIKVQPMQPLDQSGLSLSCHSWRLTLFLYHLINTWTNISEIWTTWNDRIICDKHLFNIYCSLVHVPSDNMEETGWGRTAALVLSLSLFFFLFLFLSINPSISGQLPWATKQETWKSFPSVSTATGAARGIS